MQKLLDTAEDVIVHYSTDCHVGINYELQTIIRR